MPYFDSIHATVYYAFVDKRDIYSVYPLPCGISFTASLVSMLRNGRVNQQPYNLYIRLIYIKFDFISVYSTFFILLCTLLDAIALIEGEKLPFLSFAEIIGILLLSLEKLQIPTVHSNNFFYERRIKIHYYKFLVYWISSEIILKKLDHAGIVLTIYTQRSCW